MKPKYSSSKQPSKIKQRILTASILALIIISGLFLLPHLEFTLVVFFILAIAGWEWCRLIGIKKNSHHATYLLSLGVLFFLTQMLFPVIVLLIAVLWWFLASHLIYQFSQKKPSRLLDNQWALIVIGYLLLIPCFSGFFILRAIGPGYLLLGLFLVWSTDTGAFIAGKLWGKHKLAPVVSPGKTVEGLMGGLILALLIAVVGALLLHIPYSKWTAVLLLAIMASLASVIGDLFESMIKRKFKVKDSGKWLPGHGGLLDRIDSMLCAIPVFTLGMLLLNANFNF